MEQREFHIKNGILTPEQELEVRAVYAENNALHNENAALKDENAELKERLAWFEKQVYGKKSEKTEVVMPASEQLSMFDEAESEADIAPKAVEVSDEGTVEVKSHKRKKKTHDEIFGELPVEEVFHALESKTCGKCGADVRVIGTQKMRDELVYIPARLFLRRHIAEVGVCTECGMDESRDAALPDIEPCNVITAPVPAPMMQHSFATPELVAHIIHEKYCNAVPLNRQEKDFKAKGVELSRTTMANWMIAVSELWIRPIYERMKKDLLKSSVIHADETVVQVLNEPGKKAGTDSRMWVYCSGKEDEASNVLFEYRPTRNGDHAARFLGRYSGYLICDGYDGYNKLKNVTRCGCWAHVRRKFVDALPSDKELLPSSMAAVGVEWCNKLFILERDYRGEDEKRNRVKPPLTPDERYKRRQEEVKPLLDEFFAWLDGLTVSGGTKLAKAVQYARNEKAYLYRFLEDGNIPIDNNRAENAVRPFCVGRKNWLFSASVKGADASAMLYSVAATACANGMDVEGYLTKVLKSKPGTLVMPY